MGYRLLAWCAWPLFLGAQIAVVVAVGYSRPDALARATGLTTVAVMMLLIGLEQVLPYRLDWSIRGDRDVWRDLGHAVLYAGIGGLLAQTVFVTGATSALAGLGVPHGFAVWPASATTAVQVSLVIVLGDLLEYGFHRLAHAVPWLWSLHAIHHTPGRLSTVKGPRHHYLYYLGRGLFVWLPLVMIGVPPGLIVWQFVAVVLAGVLAHANIAFRIPAVVNRLIVTPAFHRLHHSMDGQEGNSNFATVLPLWDMLLGTHADPLRVAPLATGIDGDPVPRAFVDELLWPVTEVRQRWRRA
jgi:sterol desaturase/sphingolipid hydroxylase (fatty acid hydroxylase superfamily)